jgi:predicted negative regulator of RcsB-dependent stress response
MKSLACAILFLGLVPSAHADEWYVNYQKAKEAVKAKQWQQAVALLDDAIDEKDRSGTHVKTYGMHFIPYFPYIYRGVAYFNLQDKARAKADLEKGENKQASDEDQSLLQQYLDLLHKAAEPQLPPPVAEEKKPEPKPEVKNEPKEEEKPAVEVKQQKPVTTTPREAEKQQQPRQTTQPLMRELHTPVTSRMDTVGLSRLAAARAFFDAGRYRLAKGQLTEYLRLGKNSDEANQMMSDMNVVELQVRKGIALYFDGKFGDAIAELTGASSRGRDNPHTFALLACSYAAEYLMGGAADAALKRQAFEAFGRARQLDGGYALNKEYISPRIIALLSNQ